MWIRKITLEDFRIFKEEFTIEFSKNVTCISGHNGIGKSTILAVLSNTGELKKEEGSHLNGSTFRGEFADIIKGDKEFDSTGDKAKIYFEDIPSNRGKSITRNDIYVNELIFRAHFSKDRYRLIPKKIPEIRDTESKLKWATYYLGLSRLYPVGESTTTRNSLISEEINQQLVEDHSSILSIDYGDDVISKSIGLRETSKKKVGFRTEIFSETANSAGQDNLGQIILTILSFQELKNNNPEEYKGGILLIDEIDATIHPAAQKRLFDYLVEKSEELYLQVVFTTHSFTLIEHIATQRKISNNHSKMKIIYIEKLINSLKVQNNAPIEYYKNDLADTYVGGNISDSKIKIFTEDERARKFTEIIFDTQDYRPNIEFLNVNISWGHLLNLLTSDYNTFENYIFLLDPDLYQEDNFKVVTDMLEGYPIKANENSSNVLILPTDDINDPVNIEKMLWRYLTTIPDDHKIFNDNLFLRNGWKQRLIINRGVDSEEYSNIKDENTRYKKWFDNHRFMLEKTMKYWIADYQQEITEFINKFKAIYGKLERS